MAQVYLSSNLLKFKTVHREPPLFRRRTRTSPRQASGVEVTCTYLRTRNMDTKNPTPAGSRPHCISHCGSTAQMTPMIAPWVSSCDERGVRSAFLDMVTGCNRCLRLSMYLESLAASPKFALTSFALGVQMQNVQQHVKRTDFSRCKFDIRMGCARRR